MLLKYCLFFAIQTCVVPVGILISKVSENDEYSRKWLHFSSISLLFLLIYWLFGTSIHSVICTALYSTSCLVHRYVGVIANSYSRDGGNNNHMSITLYAVAALILFIVTYINPSFLLPTGLSLFTLAFGDAAAAVIGSKYGKHKITDDKSLEGFLSFVVAAYFSMNLVCLVLGERVSSVVLVSTSIFGALIELYTGDFDNFMIPIGVALFVAVLL